MPINFSIVGSKAAGKGTQCRLLAEAFNTDYFSTGLMFHQAIKNKTVLGRVAEQFVTAGKLVPDDMVNGMVEEWLWTTTPQKGIVFDGFPRTTEQAAYLDNTFQDMERKLQGLIYLNISGKCVAQRLAGRRKCRVCKEEFHLSDHPFLSCPYKKCDGQYLSPFDEDKPEIVEKLVGNFKTEIQPLLDYFKETNRLIIVNAEEPVSKVNETIIRAVESFR